MPPASGAQKDQRLPLTTTLCCVLSHISYCLWAFHGKQSPSAPGEVSLNLQPCHHATARVILPPRAHGSGPHGFLYLDAKELFLRRNPTPGCTLQTYQNGNTAPLATIKPTQAPTAQQTHPPQEETEQGLSPPQPGSTPHPPEQDPDGCPSTIMLQ